MICYSTLRANNIWTFDTSNKNIIVNKAIMIIVIKLFERKSWFF